MPMLRRLVGPFYVAAGVTRFLIPRTYGRIMPRWVPTPEAMVYASGAAEIVGGLGMMLPARRRLAGRLDPRRDAASMTLAVV